MPTYNYIIGNSIIEKYIEENNIDKFNDFLGNNHCQSYLKKIESSFYILPPWIDYDYKKKYNLYDFRLFLINSIAIELQNANIVKHFIEKVKRPYQPDGNSYDLAELAIEKYCINNNESTNVETKQISYDIVKMVFDTIKNANKLLFNYDFATRQLTTFCNKNNNFQLLDELIKNYNICLYDVYHHSITLNCKINYDYLINNYKNKIDYKWKFDAIEVAKSFGHIDIIEHVNNKEKEKDENGYCSEQILIGPKFKLKNSESD